MYKNILSNILSVWALCFVMLLSGCNKKEETSDLLGKITERGSIIVGVKYDAKPFGYINENSVPEGFDIDLAKNIAKSVLGDENKVEFKPVTSSNRLLKLNRGDVDMLIATMSVTNQRRSIVDFSLPYYTTGQVIMVKKGSKITSISDLNGKKVIVIFGSTAEDILRNLAPDADIIGFKTYTSGYAALKQGMADAMVSDNSILLGFAIDDPSVKLLSQKYSLEPYAIAFKKGIPSQSFIEKVNFTLDYMKKSGELNKLKRKWGIN